ncbi:MAG TPA: CapA family protein [Levilinea sp.]|nr:CapA family protein [Levilinea sp.]
MRINTITHYAYFMTAIRSHFLPSLMLLFVAFVAISCTTPPASSPLVIPANTSLAETAVNSTPEPLDTTPTLPPAPTAPPTALPPSVWIDPNLPVAFTDNLELPTEFIRTDDPKTADLRIAPGAGQSIATWVYALAAPFPTIPDHIDSTNLIAFWQQGSAQGFPASRLLVSSETHALFTQTWGSPSPQVTVLPEADLLSAAWSASDAWTILPFEALAPRWKVLEIDRASPVRKDFDPTTYPLAVSISIEGDSALLSQFSGTYLTNRDPQKLTTVMLTGVTALVRGTAAYMRLFGMNYPAADIAPWLQEADILHINNEVPFAPVCPLYPPENALVFCSRPEYIELLEHIGTDVVELSGDHFHDWGDEAILYTLEMYKERGWPYYGGGANLDEARRPLLMEHNGNRIAFMGCNGKAPWYARASETEPGAWHCDIPWMKTEIARLRAEGFLVIVTFQHEEVPTYEVHPKLMSDFQPIADAGANIVSGSQAHQPQAIEFRGDSFIHYGLGNLFFDQIYISDPNAEAFIDRHIIYDGRHISTELLTIQFVDYARARPMTDAERQQLLETIFSVSIWN